VSSAAAVGASNAGAPAWAGTAAAMLGRAGGGAAERHGAGLGTGARRGGRRPGARCRLAFREPGTPARMTISSAAGVGFSSPWPEGAAEPKMFIKAASLP
jgi:hypothetical protein